MQPPALLNHITGKMARAQTGIPRLGLGMTAGDMGMTDACLRGGGFMRILNSWIV